jgi:hypothetical protein
MFDRVGQLRAVHRSRHVNIRKHNLNVRAAFKDAYGGVRIGSLDDFKTRIPDGSSVAMRIRNSSSTMRTTGRSGASSAIVRTNLIGAGWLRREEAGLLFKL